MVDSKGRSVTAYKSRSRTYREHSGPTMPLSTAGQEKTHGTQSTQAAPSNVGYHASAARYLISANPPGKSAWHLPKCCLTP